MWVSIRCGCVVVLWGGIAGAWGQQAKPDAKALAMVRVASQTESKECAADNSHWGYKDEDKKSSGVTVSRFVDTVKGTVTKKIAVNGRALTPVELQREDARIAAFVKDTGQQSKQRKDGLEDNKRGQNLLRMLPDAFLWNVKSDSGDTVTLGFVPNPAYKPPTMEARVFAAMKGEIVVDKGQNRIRTVKGELTSDVKFGYGVLGKMKKGGVFVVERREMGPREWQITETHVHIDGRSLLFKSIGEQDDEVKSEFRRMPQETTLVQAAAMLKGEPTTVSSLR